MTDTYNTLQVGTATWAGASGYRYEYEVYELDFDPAPNQFGNYIFARHAVNGWFAVDIGQGELKARKDAHEREGCVTRKGATHYHAHLNADGRARRAEESDLLAEHSEAYEPTGCNRR